jgi:hypothetical protein
MGRKQQIKKLAKQMRGRYVGGDYIPSGKSDWELKREAKEQLDRAERMSDMDLRPKAGYWETTPGQPTTQVVPGARVPYPDPNYGYPYTEGPLPGPRTISVPGQPTKEYVPGLTQEDIDRINRVGSRLSRRSGSEGGPGDGGAPGMPPGDGGDGTYWPVGTPFPGRFTRWTGWYNPGATVADQPALGPQNQLLKFMNPDDVEALARQSYVAGGGAEGPFARYLKARQFGQPVFSPPGDVWEGPPPSQPGIPPTGGYRDPVSGEWVHKWERGRGQNLPPGVGMGPPEPFPGKPYPGRPDVGIEPWEQRPPAGPPGVPQGSPQERHQQTLAEIWRILSTIEDPTARAWAEAVFDVYQDYTPGMGMRSRMDQEAFKAHLDEMMANIPEAAQPYAPMLERLVMPTVRFPAQEWYEKPEAERTASTNWSVLGLTRNPQWF